MSHAQLLALAREALLLMVMASLPAVLASLVTGLVMSLLQAANQIQEQTLTVVPKLCAAVAALVLSGPWISSQLTLFTTTLMSALSSVRV